ncbi:podocalyxin [Anas acuta]|uniref:podocalyxin n=1 Tax=Anas acuta TaxID=28680 RepID=UPI0035C8F0EE
MRAPLLLLLLLLLLHDVSSDDVTEMTTVNSGGDKPMTTSTTTSNVQEDTTTKPSTQSTGPGLLPPTASGAASTSKTDTTPSTTTMSPNTPTKPTTTSHLMSTSTTRQPAAPTAAKTTTDKQGGSTPTTTASSSTLQVHPLTSSKTTPVASTSTTQQNTNTAATSGAKPTENPVLTQPTNPPATSTGSVATVTTTPCSVGNVSCPSGPLTSTVGSTADPQANLPPSTKNHNVSSPPSVTNQSDSSPASPVHGPASSTPSAVPVSSASGKTSPSSPTGTTSKVQDVATTTTPRADRTSQGLVPDKTGATEQSPSSAQPSAPAQGDQTISSRPDQQHPNISFKNEIVCKDQIQDTWPIINLKEAKTCTDWMAASRNESFFELFCSIGQQAFDVHRDKCTVTLASSTPQRWAVHAVVHRLLQPEDVFEELKEKRNELEKLGIVNVTYLNQEMEEEVKDQFSTPLIITIITLACSLLLVAAIYGCCHQRFSQKKNQQHIHPDLPGFDDGRAILIFNQRLTEELQTMENGYHDNPTLEVMETCSEMQEKKVNLNGELGDSWIVPLDTIMKEDLEEEEDTHL